MSDLLIHLIVDTIWSNYLAKTVAMNQMFMSKAKNITYLIPIVPMKPWPKAGISGDSPVGDLRVVAHALEPTFMISPSCMRP